MAERVAIVTVVHGRHHHLARQADLLTRFHADAAWTVVAMADPDVPAVVRHHPHVTTVDIDRVDGRLPLAAARNLGVARATERPVDLVVLLDVDCVLAPDAVDAYRHAAAIAPGTLLSGPVTYLPAGVVPPHDAAALAALRDPHPARPAPAAGEVIPQDDPDLFWSLNFAVEQPVWDRIGGFCERYTGYGGEDTDFAWTARRRGVGLTWVGGADAYHQHHPVSRPPVEHVADIARNATIFHERWGVWPMRGWLDELTASGHLRWDDGRPRPATETG